MKLDLNKKTYTAQDLLTLIELLRDKEHGCPWDSVQTHTSIRMNFLEEAYEAVDAIDLDDAHLMCEELGDVLMQVVFHTVMEQERGRFTWDEVCDGVCRKLIGRHPFLFHPEEADPGINDWDAIKNKEKGRVTLADDLESVPQAMPALMRAAKLQKRAQKHGVTVPGCETLAAAETALEQTAPAEQQRQVGDWLFALADLARKNGIDPEEALEAANRRFVHSAEAEE